MSVHRLRIRRAYSTRDYTATTPPRAVRLSDTIQDRVLEEFVADPGMTAPDVVAAMTWSLALFVVASEEDDVAVDAETPILVAAIEGLRRSVETVRQVNHDRSRAARRVQ
jgi:hypothetical protein